MLREDAGICLWHMSAHRRVSLFRSGRNRAVRIAVEFELPGNEAVMYRKGDRLIIEPVRKRGLVALSEVHDAGRGRLPRDRDGVVTRYLLDIDIVGEFGCIPGLAAENRLA